MRNQSILLACLLLIFPMSFLRADVRLNPLFSDNMVLQRDMMLPIWGTAAPGENFTLTFGEQTAKVTADDSGAWRAELAAMKASKEPRELKIEAKKPITLRNILVGEVWIACGQSNMDFPLSNADGGNEAAAAADFPTIRRYRTAQRMAEKPQDTAPGKWEVTAPDNAKTFAAAPFFFARDLNKRLDVPIGIIDASWWFTPVSAWSSRELLESDSLFKETIDRYQKAVVDGQNVWDAYLKSLNDWKASLDRADAAGVPLPGKAPNPPELPQVSHWIRPYGPYNAMVHPLIPYAIRGVIYYQGETNAGAKQYARLFPAMIQDWRKRWNEGDFPFLFVQLPNFINGKYDPATQFWPEIREAQAQALKLPDTGMAVTYDLGNPLNVHPHNKKDVGLRLALQALTVAYKQDVVASGPMFDSMKIDGEKAIVKFTSTGGGLVAKQLPVSAEMLKRLNDQGPGEKMLGELGRDETAVDPLQRTLGVTWFVIAGEDKVFHPASAKIDGDTVIVSSPDVKNPVAVRYAWADNPEGANLYNKENLPAAPFRTDKWEPPAATQPTK
ncbi:MAG TPA: sialate O-acetylesterase [Tepidisphaeraceae bacterium]|jgi:sialate O-acetylesterase